MFRKTGRRTNGLPWAAFLCAFCCLEACATPAPTVVQETTTGPYTFVYRYVTGDYSGNAPVYAELSAGLREYGIDPFRSIAIYLDDPGEVPAAYLRSICGVIIEEKDWGKIERLDRKFKIQHISRAERVVSEYRRNSTGPSGQGSSNAVSEYARQKGYAPISYFEIYEKDRTLFMMSTERWGSVSAERPTPGYVGAQVEAEWPDPDWQASTPEAQGMSSRILARLLDHLCVYFDLDVLDSFLITRHGRLVAEVSVAPNKPDQRHEVHSVTKSVIGALFGIAVRKGYVKSTADKALDYFPGETFANTDNRKKSMTVGDLLDMASGLKFGESPRGSDRTEQARMNRSSDWARFTLGLPMAALPGTRFNYSNGDANVLSAILAQATGMKALAFAKGELFGPLGITNIRWSEDPHGATRGDGGIFLTPRDMAKIGYLFLRDGVWKGERLLPRGWAGNILAGQTRTGLDATYYCRLWWVDPSRTFYAACGAAGQFIIVMPREDIVAVITAKEPLTFDRFFEHTSFAEYANDLILPAVKSDGPLPEDAEAQEALARRINSFSMEARAPLPRLPEVAARVSGRSWSLAPNPMGLQSARLTMGPEAASLDLRAGNLTMSFPIGLDGVYRKSQRIDYGLGVGGIYASKGSWENDRFVFQSRVLEGELGAEVTIRFEGDQALLTVVFSDPFIWSTTLVGSLAKDL